MFMTYVNLCGCVHLFDAEVGGHNLSGGEVITNVEYYPWEGRCETLSICLEHISAWLLVVA